MMSESCSTVDHADLPLKRASRAFAKLSVLQGVLGLAALTASSVATQLYHAGGGIPYFCGGFVIGGVLIFSCLLGFRVYNKGPFVTASSTAALEVKCALLWFYVVSMALSVSGLLVSVGLIVIWILVHNNHIILVAVIFFLSVTGFITSFFGLYIKRKYSSVFGIAVTADRSVSSSYTRSTRNAPKSPYAGETNQGFTLPVEPPPYFESDVNRTSGFVVDLQRSLPSISGNIDNYEIPTEPPPPYSVH